MLPSRIAAFLSGPKQGIPIAFSVSLLQKEGFRTLSARFQDDLYVLPASIHELMLLPKQMISLANVRALLRKANQEAIKPEEWLSDQVYLYERSSDAVRLAEMEN